MEDDIEWTWEIELGLVLGEIATLEAELEPLREYERFCRIAIHGLP